MSRRRPAGNASAAASVIRRELEAQDEDEEDEEDETPPGTRRERGTHPTRRDYGREFEEAKEKQKRRELEPEPEEEEDFEADGQRGGLSPTIDSTGVEKLNSALVSALVDRDEEVKQLNEEVKQLKKALKEMIEDSMTAVEKIGLLERQAQTLRERLDEAIRYGEIADVFVVKVRDEVLKQKRHFQVNELQSSERITSLEEEVQTLRERLDEYQVLFS